MSKHVGFFFLIIFCFSTPIKLCCSVIVCPEKEKQALLKFKNSLNDPSNMLSSWNISREDNCCMWKGVVCSNLSGHVHQLHLQNPDYYEFDDLSGELNPSLLNLKELKHLDLSQNDFGVFIPSFLGLLRNLEYLNLSSAGFIGRIPHNTGNLSNLHTLSLDGYGIYDDNMEWVSGLSRLEYLSMNGVNLNKAKNWVKEGYQVTLKSWAWMLRDLLGTIFAVLHCQITAAIPLWMQVLMKMLMMVVNLRWSGFMYSCH